MVLDAGIATDDNLLWLKQNGYGYIVVARQQAPSIELEGPLMPAGDLKRQVKVAYVKTHASEEKWLYCESEAKEAVASQMRIAFKKRYEEALQKLNKGLGNTKGRKKYGYIMERIVRLKEQHSNISSSYTVDVDCAEDGKTAIAVRWSENPDKFEKRLNGHYFLRTNLLDRSPELLWQLYNSIRTVEEAFRFMKSSLGLRPVHHQKEHRVDGHLWITLLAYHLIRSYLYQLEMEGLCYGWETIRNRLSTRLRVTMSAKTESEQILYHRSTTRVEAHQQEIYRALGMTPQILKAKKTVVRS